MGALPRAALLAALAAVPGGAAAEGARQAFDCRVTLACDGAGACRPADDAALLIIEPVAVAPDGSGEFTIAYGPVSAPMTSPTPLGPFLWSETGGDAQALLLTGEATLLWHSLDPAAGTSTIRFLTCEVTR